MHVTLPCFSAAPPAEDSLPVCRYDKFSLDITDAVEGLANSHQHELLVQVFDPTGAQSVSHYLVSVPYTYVTSSDHVQVTGINVVVSPSIYYIYITRDNNSCALQDKPMPSLQFVANLLPICQKIKCLWLR